MKAAVVPSAGAGPQWADFPDPDVTEDRQIVDLVAAGIHPVVRSLMGGAHYGSSAVWPAIPGVDCVARTTENALVYTGFARAPYGTMAERISVPGQMGFELPARADPAVIAAGMNPGLSTWLPLQTIADRAAESSVLITGSTGAAGRLAVQNARALGVTRVVATVRQGSDGADLADLGASRIVSLAGDRDSDARRVQEALEGQAPSLVLDLVWGWVAETLFAALTGRGLEEQEATRYVHIGAMGGATAAVPGALLRSRPIEIVGNGAGSASMAKMIEQVPVYLQMLAAGTVRPEVSTFPLADVARAWTAETPGVRNVVLG